jgi:hypothetical protein
VVWSISFRICWMRPWMLSDSPEPSMIVVESLSMTTFLALPRSSILTPSSSIPSVLGDRGAARQDRDVLEHGLAAVAEARRLDRGALEGAAQLVDDERRERLALDVLGDQQQRLARLRDLLEQRDEVLDRGDLLLVDQDERIVEHDLHVVGTVHEVGGQVALVELHALDPLDVRLEALALLDRDDAVLADLVHGLGDHLADLLVVVRRDGADLGDLGLALHGRADLLQLLDDRADGLLDTALDADRARAGDDVPETLDEDRLREDGGGGRAVARDVARLAGDLLDHLRAHVLVRVLELDLLGDGDAVLGDRGSSEALLDEDVPTPRPQSDLHGAGELLHTGPDLLAPVLAEGDVLGCHLVLRSCPIRRSRGRHPR